MDFTTVTAAVTGELADNGVVIAGLLGLSLGVGFVLRLIKRAAK